MKRNFKKYSILSLCVLLVSFFILTGCNIKNPNVNKQNSISNSKATISASNKATPSPTPTPKKLGSKTITVAAIGDVMAHITQIKSAYDAKTGTYDFDSYYQDVKSELESPDLTVGNMEGTLGGKEMTYSGYPMFNCPESMVTALKKVGVDVLTTANNHCLDRRIPGLLKTIEFLDSFGIKHTGTFANEGDNQKALIMDVKGIKIGILAYTYGANGMEKSIPQDKLSYMVNLIDPVKIKNDIHNARTQGADIVMVAMHWGTEYTRQPNDTQKKLADQLFKDGADVILGSHPHMIQPIERKTVTMDDGTKKDVVVIYSLGNFVSNQRDQYKDSGMILNLKFTKDFDANKVTIDKVSYIPTWVERNAVGSKYVYRILPVGKYLNGNSLGKSEEQKISSVWNETTSLVGDTAADPEKQ